MEDEGGCGCGGGYAWVTPHYFLLGLLHEPLIFLVLLTLFPVKLQAAAGIFLLNYNFDYVILYSINLHDSTLLS